MAALISPKKSAARTRPVVLWLYLARQIAAPFGMGLTILLFSLSLERLLRLVDMVASDGAPVSKAFLLLAYLMPHYLSLSLPASFFLSAVLALRGLQEHFELTIIQSAGLSLRRLLAPLLALAGALAALVLLLTGYVEPYARYAYRAQVYELSASGQIMHLQPGIFTAIDRHLTARAEQVTQQGKHLDTVFVTNTEANGDIVYAASRSARVEKDETTGNVTLVLVDGNMIRKKPDQSLQTLSYVEYPWKMVSKDEKTYGGRGKNEREMTFPELVAGGVPGIAKSSKHNQEMTELHMRLVQAATLPLYALLALPLALIGSGRTGKAYGIGVAIAVLILYDKILGIGESLSGRGHITPGFAQWVPWLGLGLLGWLALAWKTPRRLKTPPGEGYPP